MGGLTNVDDRFIKPYTSILDSPPQVDLFNSWFWFFLLIGDLHGTKSGELHLFRAKPWLPHFASYKFNKLQAASHIAT